MSSNRNFFFNNMRGGGVPSRILETTIIGGWSGAPVSRGSEDPQPCRLDGKVSNNFWLDRNGMIFLIIF